MSTLRVNTIQNQPGTGAPNIDGLAKAWVNFNGTGTVAIRAAFNVSSITDNGTGQYRVNFTNALVDANYSSVATSQEYTADAIGQAAKTTTQCSIWNVDSRSYSYVDTAGMNVAIFR